jgi:SWI/SNF-related matrix-associated actin-dependent regulator 1 of chromatin subfamily A
VGGKHRRGPELGAVIRLTLEPAGPHLVSATPSAYDEAVKVQMAAVPGIRWDHEARCYLGWPEAIQAAAVTLMAAKVAKVAGEPGGWHRLHVGLRPPPPGLLPYQIEGAQWCADLLASTGGALLADEMGIGKTAQAIAAALALGVSSVAVTCPAVVVRHWWSQIAKWAPDAGITWTVQSYEKFTKSPPPAARLLIVDELHYVANPTTKRSKAVASYRAAHGPMMLGLTGTPITTEPSDFWHPLDLLHPGRWGSRFAFQKRYCGGRFEEIPGLDKAKWVCSGATHLDELQNRLQAAMLRRTKADVRLQLPSRTRTVIEVELPAKARAGLAAAARALDWNGSAAKAGVGALLSQAEEWKVKAAVELARDVIANGGRPLVLTTRKATAETIADELRCPCATGDIHATMRRDALLSGTGAAVSTIYAVTTGIDLVQFDSIIFTALDWVPATLLQAEARVHRIGQERSVTIYYLCALGSIDEVVRERVIDRLDTIGTLLGGDEALMSKEIGGNDDDLLAGIVAGVMARAA